MALHLDLVVFSHLRWDFVYQRPQQVLSRLAADRRVLFVEEPMHTPGAEPHWHCDSPAPNVTVCRPQLPTDAPGFQAAHAPQFRRLLDELMVEHRLKAYATWYYTPMALPIAGSLRPRVVVYDCMDELSAFAGAPPELLEQEKQLLLQADVVFTGGPSLYRAKQSRHHNVHCFSSSVDIEHFGKARTAMPDPTDQADIPHPRLGFFGVIDERLDRDLLAVLASARPNWSIVMVGPVVKIDRATLPQAPNLHYLDSKTYDELPAYLAVWDVCLLPFARNEATRFISPTKTLEYMAAEKPIVSTPITDVAQPYGEIVHLGDTPQAFIAACEAALAADDQHGTARRAAMRQVLQSTSWDATAQAMSEQIRAAAQIAEQQPEAKAAAASTSTAEHHRAVVIGAGPTGLSAAYHLGAGSLLLERNDTVGGWCRSVYDKGFTFDMAGHIMFSKEPYVHELYEKLLGGNVHWQDREAWIYSKNVYTRYPFQGCLYGLPSDVIAECILGAIEARFGSLQPPDSPKNSEEQPAPRSSSDAACPTPRTPAGPSDRQSITDCCADGILETEAELATSNGHATSNNGQAGIQGNTSENFEDFIYRVWGKGIARHFAIPYNRKLWAVPLTEMETSWLGGRVPMPDLEQMVRNAVSPASKPMGPNARFGYPLRGGYQALMNGFLPHVQDRLRLNTAVQSVSPSRHLLTTEAGQQISYDHLVSTMPLPVLIRVIGEEAPADVRAAAEGLRYVSVRCVNLGVGREALTDKHWIYYPEDTVFHRIFVQGNASPHCNPPGGFGLTCEITYSPTKPLPCEGDDLIHRCIDDCRRVGIFHEHDAIWVANQVDMHHAYVVYDHARPRNVAIIRNWLAKQNIVLAGRYSEWEYYNSDHAFIAGRNAANQVLDHRADTARTAAA